MFAVTSGLAALSSAAEPSDPMLAQVGAEMFKQYCASCHGMSGEGDGPVAGSLKKPPADLTRIAARRGGQFPDADISRWIDGRFDAPAHGTREMPVWGRQFQDAVGNRTDPDEVVRGRLLTLVEYLKTIQKK
ncbi:MAG: c-type cytochrome [Proteobacteria bacterium]|nr:c-type cytochrome [Pseudomonadota bacterium]